MKFTVTCDVLVEAVPWTARASPARPAAPILVGVHTQAEAEEPTLSPFDCEASANSYIPATAEEAGEVLVPGHLLADISKSLPNKPVTTELDGQKVKLTCGSSHFTLAVMPLDEYPLLPTQLQTTGTADFQVPFQAVSQVSIAASRDDTPPLLTGVCIEIDDEHMTFLATDRYRFAMCKLEQTPADPAFEHIALVKTRVLQDVAKLMTSGGTVELGISDSSQQGASSLIGSEASGCRTTSTLMDGDYPPVRRLFPESTPIQAVCDRYTLPRAVKRMSLVARRKTSVRLFFTDGSLVLEVGQGNNAQASEALEANLYGEDIVAVFNPQLLIDGLSVMDTGYVRFGSTHPNKLIVMTGQTEADEGKIITSRYLFTPIRSGVWQMQVSHLALDDFRPWKRVVFELSAGPLVFLGYNGQGKTNLVEAIAYLPIFSSHCVPVEGSFVRIPTHEGEPMPVRAFVRVKTVCDEDREQVVELEIVCGKADRARINWTNVRPREILGFVRTVALAPEDLQLVRGDPSV